MKCPYCSFAGSRRELHAHLVEEHGAEVLTRFDEEQGKMFYEVSCLTCGQKIEKRVKPRWRDPGFLEEFSREIRLVAFDLLLYHLELHSNPGQDSS